MFAIQIPTVFVNGSLALMRSNMKLRTKSQVDIVLLYVSPPKEDILLTTIYDLHYITNYNSSCWSSVGSFHVLLQHLTFRLVGSPHAVVLLLAPESHIPLLLVF